LVGGEGSAVERSEGECGLLAEGFEVALGFLAVGELVGFESGEDVGEALGGCEGEFGGGSEDLPCGAFVG